MKDRLPGLWSQVHLLASRYHWSEVQILSLSLPRRQRYLLLFEEEQDAALLGALFEGGG
ncbi:MAG TPA: hypothetical protein PKY30_06610 [Myxococcota bacterium]|nr:hypothetical protein [Myxococcota bacterium]HNH46690.1 hypothetical protein [Myxococcota bacterium]